ncbi:5-hydroxyisourate hydrolase precursor [Mycobacterium marinum]|uniref:5-hydroxyisourate hydrolase n=1 Tax=Mycobacterium marinum TaxID=1781 RepID=A0A3E2MWG4_MYCMR|nr:5-hydroxyisourate hydrolase precursor [Mycobacterium marinum]GJO50704.1 5-hydroxyisourate hydrolase [Mycobacterium marinum]
MELTDAAGTPVASGRTDDDGRIKSLGAALAAGIYRLRFDTGEYFAVSGTAGFYPEVVIAFDLTDVDAHYHVPLLLSPYAYSTYRGS